MGTVTLLGCSQGHRRRKSHAASSPAAQVNDLIWPFRTHFSACPRALTAGKTARERDPTYKNSEGFSIVGSRSKKVKDRELGVLKAKGCQTPISFPHHSASASELAPPVQAYFFLSWPVKTPLLGSSSPLDLHVTSSLQTSAQILHSFPWCWYSHSSM